MTARAPLVVGPLVAVVAVVASGCPGVGPTPPTRECGVANPVVACATDDHDVCRGVGRPKCASDAAGTCCAGQCNFVLYTSNPGCACIAGETGSCADAQGRTGTRFCEDRNSMSSGPDSERTAWGDCVVAPDPAPDPTPDPDTGGPSSAASCLDRDGDGACSCLGSPPSGPSICGGFEAASCDDDVREQRADGCPDIVLTIDARVGSGRLTDFPVSGRVGCNGPPGHPVTCEVGVNLRTGGLTDWVVLDVSAVRGGPPAVDVTFELWVDLRKVWTRTVNQHVAPGSPTVYRQLLRIHPITGELREDRVFECPLC